MKPKLASHRAPSRPPRTALWAMACVALAALAATAGAQDERGARATGAQEGTAALVRQATAACAARPDLAQAPEDVKTFHRHVTVLASPWMEGRLPGTRGMELATQYMEDHFREAGLCAPFERIVKEPDGTETRVPHGSFRQSFGYGVKVSVSEGYLALDDGGAKAASVAFEHGVQSDFVVTTMGGGGEVRAPLVFVGYAIDHGPREEREFSSFPEGLSLAGQVALVLRFEPMDAAGRSRWGTNGWSKRAMFEQKLAALQKLGAEAAIIVNAPGADDPRAATLVDPAMGWRAYVDFPVLHLTAAAGERLIAGNDPQGRSLLELRRIADEGPAAITLKRGVVLRAGLVEERLVGENVIALLPGQGALAQQLVVLGAHLDHIGLGSFKSRDREAAGRVLHPGADDNASGCAALLMLADRLAREQRLASPDEARRSIAFIAFSAEESGLAGSAYYVNHPLVPLAEHTLMLNLGMLGRIEARRLRLFGATSGVGCVEFLEPFRLASPLEISLEDTMNLGGDHMSFLRRNVPALFARNDLHDDYHTPGDTSEKINCFEALHALEFFHDVAAAAAVRPEPFVFAGEYR